MAVASIKFRLMLLFLSLNILNLGNFCYAFIDEELFQSLNNPLETSDVLINFAGGNSQVIKNVESKVFPDELTKMEELVSGLEALTDLMQTPIIRLLEGIGVQIKSFWASNQMVIKNASLSVLSIVDLFPQVARIQRLPIIQLNPLISSEPSSTDVPVGWNLVNIKADEAWVHTRGEHAVVANIDTGVRYTYEALNKNWRSAFGWYDPYNTTEKPHDKNGHGTHTMGTAVGQKGIGVAPKATWIACRGCDTDQCDGGMLLACGQWCAAPTKPDGVTGRNVSMRPNVIFNSWGSLIGGDPWYNGIIKLWTIMKMIHAFAIGNSGPLCFSGGSPGDQKEVFSVGSVDKDDALSLFSSKGTFGKHIKPDISAPGSNVRSAWNTADNAYNTISGTSMATPSVAGTLALMLSKWIDIHGKSLPTFNQNVAVKYITQTTDITNLKVPAPNFRCEFNCEERFPNEEFGAGRVNALQAVEAIIHGLPSKNVEKPIQMFCVDIIIFRGCIKYCL